MTGMRPPCANDDHPKHQGRYPVKIGRKSSLGQRGRDVECGCSRCVRRAEVQPEATTERRPFLVLPTVRYTMNPCGSCSHPSYWLVRPGTRGVVLVPVTLELSSGRYCKECPTCAEKLSHLEVSP